MAGTDDPVFDRTFVIGATAIGASYAFIVVGIAALIGKEAAGVAGVALTALATAIFKQFETLRFKQASDTDSIEIARVLSWRMLLVVLSFSATQLFMGFLVGFGSLAFKYSSTILTDSRLAAVSFIGVSALLGGFIVAKSFPAATYSYATVGALGALLISTTVDFAKLAINNNWWQVNWGTSLSFWLVYPASALLGAKLAHALNMPVTRVHAPANQPLQPTSGPE